jgi:N-acetylglucosaminyldiphosphoundecaprenol N-acetyl-beta-D-mannosaminyltransferase
MNVRRRKSAIFLFILPDSAGYGRQRIAFGKVAMCDRKIEMRKLGEVLAFGGKRPSGDAVDVNVSNKAALLSDIKARLAAGQGFTVATINLDHIVKLRKSPSFLTAYRQHSHVVADGNPIVWLMRLAGRPVGLVPGSELIDPLCGIAASLDVPVAMLGSTQETLDLAAERLTLAHPGLRVVARIAPAFGYDPQGAQAAADLQTIASSGARLCFLALGAPKQEILAIRGQSLLPDCGFISIGAGLDFIAGHQTRAPRWVRRIAMEWFWRMATQPRRLFGRYVECAAILPGLGIEALKARRERQI